MTARLPASAVVCGTRRTVSGVRFDQPGDIDLAAESIRLTRQLAAAIDHPEVAGLLALMLFHHARRATRTAPDGSLVPLARQERGRWDTESIAEGVEILQAALARDRLGEFQAQAAIAALHADAPTARRLTGCRSSSGTTSSRA